MLRIRLDKRSLAQATLLFLLLTGFFLPAFVVYDRIDRTVRSQRADFAASQVANRIAQTVESRLEVLGILEYLVPALGLDTEAQFAAWSKRIERDVRGFYALNWVNADGVITWVVPYSQNRQALGRNLLLRRELAPYLEAGRATGRPALSHILPLYQGPMGLILYVPVFGKDRRFVGWIDGVFGVDELIGDVVLGKESDAYDFRLDFLDHPGSFYEHGQLRTSGGAVTGRKEIEVLNQRIGVTVQIRPESARLRELDRLQWLIVLGVAASSLVLSVFAYQVILSRVRLRERLEKEHFQSVLLNLLVHDIVNPLLVVRFATDAALRLARPDIKGQLDKIVYALSQVTSVLTRVKDMRAVELGKMRLEVDAVPVEQLFADVLTVFDERLKAKSLTLDVQLAAPTLAIMVDRVTFQNNVLNNLVSNAVKFSEPGGTVTLRAEVAGDEVLIEVVDQGIGMSEETARHVFLENFDVTKPGTLGERGTGIGMLQVRSYTRIFGGRVAVRSKQKRPGVVGHGTRVQLFLQKA